MENLAFADLATSVSALYRGRDPSFRSRLEFWIAFFGDRDVTALSTDDIEDGIDALIRRGKLRHKAGEIQPTGEPLSHATVNRHVAALGTCFNELKRTRRLPRGFRSPMKGVTRLSEDNARTLNVNVDDVRRLVGAARLGRNRKLAALIAMAATTGLRLSNLRGLLWGDVDLTRREAVIGRTKNGTPTVAGFPAWAADELLRIRPETAQDHERIFDDKDFRKAWASALERAGLPLDWCFHHCRHMAASILAHSGASLPVIMQALNHKTPLMAMRYSHVNTKALSTTMSKAWG